MPKLAALTLFLISSLAQAGALAQLERFVQTKTLAADFKQTATVRGKTQISEGQLAISRPDRFRWEYDNPEPQLIVGDGRQLWIYDQDLNQVSVKNQKSALGETPASLLAGGSSVNRHYTLAEQGSRNGLDWLEAKPKAKDQGFAVIRMGFNGDELKAMELTDFTGQTTRIDFAAWKKNPVLAARQFQFTPPSGADVLRD